MDLLLASSQKFQLSEQTWWIVFALIFTVVIGPIFNYFSKEKYNFAKRIKITGMEIFNINNRNGMIESLTSPNDSYSNFIYNRITVENRREVTQTITSIELYDIKKENLLLSDIEYDGGFYVLSQKFALISYNNGNQAGETTLNTVKIYTRTKATFDESFVESILLPIIPVDEGEVKSLFIKSLSEYKPLFESDIQLQDIVIKVYDNNDSVEYLSFYVQYNRDEKRFINHPRGFAGPHIENMPLFDLRDNATSKVVNCSQPVKKGGDNSIGFTILVDTNCRLSYKLNLRSGEKTFKGKQKYEVNIRVPKYKQEHTTSMGDFYELVRKHNPQTEKFNYNLEVIRSLDESLIFNPIEAAERFGEVKIK